MEKKLRVAVIGGGAAGFFAALSVAEHHPKAHVILFEKTNKFLSKVKISGGGRCNVTHNCTSIPDLIQAYPRGGRQLRNLFYQFQPSDTREWFESRGVPLKTEADGRMFPQSDSSQSIIDCLENACNLANVERRPNTAVEKLIVEENQWSLQLKDDTVKFDRVIVTTGGTPKAKGFEWLTALGHRIESPVPSLFTFNMPTESIRSLMGLVAPHATVQIIDTKIKTEGPLLITHWGMSGPAVLKASAFGARILAERKYHFSVRIQWLSMDIPDIFDAVEQVSKQFPHQKITKRQPFDLPNRLWLYFIEKLNLPEDRKWNELGQKNRNRLVELLTNDIYEVAGKTTFKEEFVTCGGVSLEAINLKTMESKKHPGLYFAGEVLDIDAITGGYNFQAAWSGGFVAGKLE
jgi:predicted Rossmann fold flavoprotein